MITQVELELIKRRTECMEKAEWLFHTTTPWNIVDTCTDDIVELSKQLNFFYKNNLDFLIKEMLANAAFAFTDIQTKETILGASKATKEKLYRASSCLLFSEVERQVRINTCENMFKRISSIKDLRSFAENISPSEIKPSGYFGFKNYKSLQKHFFEEVNEVNFKNFAKSLIPNRHAIMHGLIPHNNLQANLNTFFMADFVFQIIFIQRKHAL